MAEVKNRPFAATTRFGGSPALDTCPTAIQRFGWRLAGENSGDGLVSLKGRVRRKPALSPATGRVRRKPALLNPATWRRRPRFTCPFFQITLFGGSFVIVLWLAMWLGLKIALSPQPPILEDRHPLTLVRPRSNVLAGVWLAGAGGAGTDLFR